MPYVSNKSLREALKRSDYSIKALAERAGRGESSVRRDLGLKAGDYRYRDGKRYGPYRQELICEENALRYAEALNLDPIDLGF